MDIRVAIDTDEVLKLVSTAVRQLPYAINNAINRTAKEAVEAARAELRRDVTIRKQFILNRIRILQYSKVGNLTGIIGVDPKVQGAPLLLGFLEEGGEKLPIAGSEIAIPLTGEAARPTFQQSVPTSYRYKNLRFVGGAGRKNTYVVPNVGVFQRVAKGNDPSSTVLIYSFKPSVPLPIHTHLRAAIVDLIDRRFAEILNEEFTKEILARAEHLAS